MTPAPATRPVLIALALSLAGCGAVDGGRPGFQAMAERVAAIDIPLDPKAVGPADATPSTAQAQAQGLRPAKFSPAHVAVLTPHQMWDARDVLSQGGSLDAEMAGGRLRDAVARMAEPAVKPALRAAAPVVAEAMVDQAVARTEAPQLRPAVIRAGPSARTGAMQQRTIQLGAYSSEAGAQAAWSRLKANPSLANLAPVFEAVQVEGRSLTRLKVGPIPTEAASALCAAAQVADPWCRRAG